MKTTRTITFSVALFVAIASPVNAENPSDIYEKSVHGVIWIPIPFASSVPHLGSGFLVDKDRRLVVTCNHVVKNAPTFDMFFATRDSSGEIIINPEYYLNPSNRKQLETSRVRVNGRVCARSPQKDLAILQLSELPTHAAALSLAKLEPTPSTRILVLSNPAFRKLWRSAPGTYCGESVRLASFTDGQTKQFRGISLFCNIYAGDSGAPVLSDDGVVLGVVQSTVEQIGGMCALAVHFSEVQDLIDSLQETRAYRVRNSTSSELTFKTKWGNSKWTEHVLKQNAALICWSPYGEPELSYSSGPDTIVSTPGWKVAYVAQGDRPDDNCRPLDYEFHVVNKKMTLSQMK